MLMLSNRINQWLLSSKVNLVVLCSLKALNVGGILCSIKNNCVSSLVIVDGGLATILLAVLFVYMHLLIPGGHYEACPSLWMCWNLLHLVQPFLLAALEYC